MKIKKTLIATLLAMSTATAFAADWSNNLYGGVNVGHSKLKGFSGEEIAPGVVTNNSDTSYGLNLGYQFNPGVGLELGYKDLGDYPTSLAGVGLGDIKAKAWDLSVVGRHALTEQFALTGKLGVAHTKAKFEGESQSKTTPVYGLGAEYAFNHKVALTANWDRYHNFADLDHKLDNLSVGVKYRF